MSQKLKTIVITGITGSGASYLAEHLCNSYDDIELHGISHVGIAPPAQEILRRLLIV